jgi:ubiquinone/menaquinone biosynthesis C-methylase UbiE
MTSKQISVVPDVYDPFVYWNTREQPNTEKDPGISAAHAGFITEQISPGDALLEIGPGVGRLFELYKKCGSVATVDVSKKYVAAVEEAANRHGLKVAQHHLASIDAALPFESKAFDVGIASYVLIHVPFDRIEHTMSEMARVCRKVAVISGIDDKWPSNESERKPSSLLSTQLCRDMPASRLSRCASPRGAERNSLGL